MEEQENRLMTKQHTPIHPGEILADKLAAIDLNASQLAERIQVPKNRIYQILEGRRAVTADTALRLGKFFGTDPELWLNLQKAYELAVARQNVDESLAQIQPHHPIDTVRAGIRH